MHERRERSQSARGYEKHETVHVWNEKLFGETRREGVRERSGEGKIEAEGK